MIDKENIDFLVGGTMTGLRMLNFALLLGFKTIEYYGLDSCFSKEIPKLVTEDDPRYEEVKKKNKDIYYEDALTNKKYVIEDSDNGGFFYAYKKKHNGSIQVATTPDGRRFLTSPVFAHQAKQFIKWHDRFEGKLKVILHGDNLTSSLLKCHLENIENRKNRIGDKKWNDGYYPLFKEFFSRGNHVKISDETQGIIDRAIPALQESLNREPKILYYDKAIIGETEINERYDIVTCFNLLEHVEIECVDNVLKDIKNNSKYMVILHISLGDAGELLSDGRDAHITSKSGIWWKEAIERHFMVVEGMWIGGYNATFICQNYNAQEYLKEEVL